MTKKILALETCGISGEVALLEGNAVLFESALESHERSAKYLSARISSGLQAVGWTPSDIELVAVTTGPGSFTGLRVGVTTAKVFAYSTHAEVIGVNSLMVGVAQVRAEAACEVCAVIDAHREEVFAATYEIGDSRHPLPQLRKVPRTIKIADWINDLLEADPVPTVTGPALAKLKDQLPAKIRVAAQECWTPRATTVGKIGLTLHLAGVSQDLWSLAPEYYRKSAAEEKRDGS